MNEEVVKIGEVFNLGSEPHFVTGVDSNGGVELKTFNEVYEQSNCKGCKYLFKEQGHIFRERGQNDKKIPFTVGCKLGQFGITHNPTVMLKKCKLKDYIYSERQHVKEHLTVVMKNRSKDAYALIEPNFWGMNFFHLAEPKVRHIITSDIRKCVRE